MAWNIKTPPNLPSPSTSGPSVDRFSIAKRFEQIPLSFYGLFVGILGLGLATIPSIAMERPLPNPFGKPTEAKRTIEDPSKEKIENTPLKKRGITFKLKGISVNFGKEIQKPAEQTNPTEPQKSVESPNLDMTNDPVRWFSIAALVCGLIGLALSAIALTRERRTAVTVTAIGCSIVAMIWQYVLFGIVAGVIIVVVLLLLMILADLWG